MAYFRSIVLKNIEITQTYGLNELINLMSYLKITDPNLPTYFDHLIQNILNLNEFDSLKSLSPEIFWAKIFKNNDFIIIDNLKRIIKFAITPPSSNAICER